MTPEEETCGGRGSEWLTPCRRGINSSLKEMKTIGSFDIKNTIAVNLCKINRMINQILGLEE